MSERKPKTVKFHFDERSQVTEDEAFAEIMAMTPQQVDTYLRDNGYDPEQVRYRGKVFIDILKENLKLRARVAELEAHNAQMFALLKRLAWACWSADCQEELPDNISGELYDELMNYAPGPDDFTPPDAAQSQEDT